MFFKKRHSFIIEEITERINSLEDRIMSALTDAVTRITTSTQNEIAAVIAALSGANPDVTAAIAQLTTLADHLDAETAALAPPPPIVPPPAP